MTTDPDPIETVKSWLLRVPRFIRRTWVRSRDNARFRDLSPDAVFSDIFHSNHWANAESRSGSGSTLEQTDSLRQALPHLLRWLEVRTLIDAPCGDLNWMRHTDLGIDRYVGVDIVPELIEELVRTNATPRGVANAEFLCRNISSAPLPPADAVFCRDALVHLSFAEGTAALANFRATGSRWLLSTTFPSVSRNVDIVTGRWRPINLQLPPYSMSRPVALFFEGSTERGASQKAIGIWSLAATKGQ